MTMARVHLVDVSVTRWYHCVKRCVRRALLLGEAPWNRKEWIERRLQELAEIFAVAVGGFSVLNLRHAHSCASQCPKLRWNDVQSSGRQRSVTHFTRFGARLPAGEGLVSRHDPCM